MEHRNRLNGFRVLLSIVITWLKPVATEIYTEVQG